MLHFKEGIGWKACCDDERNLYTAKTSWRGDFHLYEIDAEIYNQLGEPGVYADELIHSGRHLYYSQDNPIGPPTDMIIDENYATLCSWAVIHSSKRSDYLRFNIIFAMPLTILLVLFCSTKISEKSGMA